MEKPTYLLLGASPEALGLCHALGISLAGVSDPIFGGRRTRWFDLPAYGNDQDACQKSNASSAVLAIDNSRIREQVYRSLTDARLDFPPVSGGYLGAEPASGLFLQRLGNVSEGCILSEGVRVNIGGSIMHECVVGRFVTIGPGAVVLGKVTLGDHCYIGANATVLPGLSIGAGALVGAGAVVTKDVTAGAVVKGNPAR
jgi:hypothetical protein